MTHSNPTFIPGKDKALEDSLIFMQSQLSRLGFNVQPVSWLNPLPHVWSVHVQDQNCPHCFTNGKGASKEAALVSALGEFFERLATNYFWADYWLAEGADTLGFVHYPDEIWVLIEQENQKLIEAPVLLDDYTREVYDAEAQIYLNDLIDINTGQKERGVCALPFIRQSDQTSVYFPVNLIGNLYVSNGMSAGNTPAEAQVQALSEIFERAIKNRILAEGIRLPKIPEQVLKRYPKIYQGIQALKEAGFTLFVQDASLGGHFPVINISLLNPRDGGCFASFGAHPLFEVALERTLTELVQGRALDALDGFPAPSLDMAQVADEHNLETHFIDSSGLVSWHLIADAEDYDYCAWNFSGETRAQRDHLLERLHDLGYQVYIAEYQHLGVYACRILVPGFSEIYPIDELQWHNNNQSVPVRDAILQLAHLQEETLHELQDTLDALEIDDQQKVAAWLGIASASGSQWQTWRLGELGACLALATGDWVRALAFLDNVLLFDHLDHKRKRQYQVLQSLLSMLVEGLEPESFHTSLHAYYGTGLVQQALGWIEGEGLFDALIPEQPATHMSAHQALLNAYQKVQAAKAAVHT
ncbi:ribosomal protein S12 methylthiotransferase accessory factor [Allopseudospirillum japonicum]|uniref:Ribosomal protein S12 methylthiotransferase accessory factor n=1 Tax=Allopseudospirillum japonicum TaxID=64971 RepID=A0A1H6QH28_9GAMM|nr:30S ribosomal protein S12 methylthiotransferase accessory factor YcaO [Allopseudospirillum japonicum]SEI39517.1 ribosomal protein S12 methylthiotransferase accessory factor [Allopseudospirillum japonicum]